MQCHLIIENMPYRLALAEKSKCDFFIDQIGELGYGLNSVESLGMGIPTAVELLPDFEAFLGEHPFYNIRGNHLIEDLHAAFADRRKWPEKSLAGKRWVREKHSIEAVVNTYL